MFCAAGETRGLIEPARFHSICAVDGYYPGASPESFGPTRNPVNFLGDDHLHPLYFLCPATGHHTIQPDGRIGLDFGLTSAACAFASGIAALYLHQHAGDIGRALTSMRAGGVSNGGPHRALIFPV